MTKKLRHRWLVALPLMAVVVALNVVHAVGRVHELASVVQYPKEVRVARDAAAQVVQLPHATVRREPGALLDTFEPTLPILKQGTALFASNEFFQVEASSTRFEG